MRRHNSVFARALARASPPKWIGSGCGTYGIAAQLAKSSNEPHY
jgi:hypothetical protein